jgi:cytochrome c oxidase subunit 1
VELPRIRSESPAFDLHHPEVALLEFEENARLNVGDQHADAPPADGREEHLRDQVDGASPPGERRNEEGRE